MSLVLHQDAVIIGAGISGISAAYHFQKHCPGKSYRILERRTSHGGTWDLFNYPGIRSDSDMYTFGFSFRPWSSDTAIAEKQKILDYLADTMDEYGIDENVQYGVQVQRTSWSSEDAKWSIDAIDTETGDALQLTSNYIFMCVGYYNYDRAYQPDFDGIDDYKGQVIHPQFWDPATNYSDKNIVVIGSGATAITLIPALAEKAKHVTMLQRSPTYIASKPAVDPIGSRIAALFGHAVARWWFILASMFIFNYCRRFPNHAKKAVIDGIKTFLGDKFEPEHFTPKYAPWDQRFCLCPDSDFFFALKNEQASIVTDHIDHFTETGIKLQSGSELTADIVVSATGLEMLFLGGIETQVDGKTLNPSETYIYKGFMCDQAPNMFASVGYTNASWTLKVDLTNKYACRLINHIDRKGYRYCAAQVTEPLEDEPLLDLSSGYIQRGLKMFPKQAKTAPWRLRQNYILDALSLKYSSVADNAMKFYA